ncbi:MAG: HAD hydrolase-like protein [Methylobacteriaceae bacterium]|nr:HAD hydrolase-like protein [Methylobacteriaceae bacterium]MBV9701744.1 HAD hydrolase-like protein [Methylobacteriaceae bacterium]
MAAGARPLIVFDLDGTLADTAGDLIATLNVILDREGIPPLPLAQARPMLGAGARALITRGLAAAGRTVSGERLERMFGEFLAHYEAHIADHSELFPGVASALERFAQAGFLLAVCTNKLEALSVQLLAALGVAGRFGAICGQDTFAVCKPDPSALHLTIERAGGGVSRTVMIGDSKTDIDTARAAFVPIVAVDFGYTDLHVSHYGPDRIISHFDEAWDAVGGVIGK